jgi:hypothetical protein
MKAISTLLLLLPSGWTDGFSSSLPKTNQRHPYFGSSASPSTVLRSPRPPTPAWLSTNTVRLYANENDKNDYLPETSFGAEAVPEGQRPINEYLDMKRAPLFDWASNEVGPTGLLKRLGIVYVACFAAV